MISIDDKFIGISDTTMPIILFEGVAKLHLEVSEKVPIQVHRSLNCYCGPRLRTPVNEKSARPFFLHHI